MKTITKTILALTPKQSKILRDKSRYKMVRAGRRFGKTVLAIAALLNGVMNKPGEYWFVSPYYRQSKNIAWKLLNEYAPKELVASKNENELILTFNNGGRISLKGADNENSLRGTGLSGCVLDEAAFQKPTVWSEIIRPMLFDEKGWCIQISTPNSYNWWWRMYSEAESKPDWSCWHYTSYDNPHLSREEIDQSRHEMSEEKFSQEILAEFTKVSGAIWPEFSREVHVYPKRNPAPDTVLIAGIDWGFAKSHPTSVAFFEVNGQGDVYCFDGFMQEGLTIDKIDEMMRAMTNGLVIRAIYADSARPDLIEELQRRNWNVLPANKSVEMGISKVSEYLAINPLTQKPRLTFANTMVDQIRQLEQYSWEEVRGEDGTFKQTPRKMDDDFCDCVRYVIFNYTTPNISDTWAYEEYKGPWSGL